MTNNKKTLVYVIIKSKFDCAELRFSLRSIERFCSGTFKNIAIVGYIPDFIDQSKVLCYPYTKPKGIDRNYDQYMKILHALYQDDITDDFVHMHDDFFYIKPTNLSELPNYYRGELKDKPSEHSYWNYMYNTRVFLEKHNMPTIDWDCHAPFNINKSRFLESWEYAEIEHDSGSISFRAFYHNYWTHKLGIQPPNSVLKVDTKVNANNIHKFDKEILNTSQTMFSIADDCIPIGMGHWLLTNFPNKSQYETTELSI
jgi:hypothetical protein